MDLDTVRAAVNDIEREMKKVGNKIKYREKVVQDTLGEIVGLKTEHEALVDRYVDLVAQERALKENTDG